MSRPIRVVQFVNQFYAQVGGEEKAGLAPQLVQGAAGAARATAQVLGSEGSVVATLLCGDNYAAEHTESAVRVLVDLLRPLAPDLVLAGPAFNAGRYGVACGALCTAVQAQLGIPAVTGMCAENPGVDLYRRGLYIIETGTAATEMLPAITRMLALGRKLVAGDPIGRPAEEGYFPRGITRNELATHTGAERATTMLLAKLRGQAFETEVPVPQFEHVTPPARVADLRRARVALVTDGGFVPKGNPDGIEPMAATKYGGYDVSGKDALQAAEYDNVHRGYDTTYVKQDPNRLIPLDVVRELEQEGKIGALHDIVYSTTGVATTLENSRRMGQEIAAKLKAAGVDAVILTST